MTALTRDEITQRRRLVQQHDSLMVEYRAEQERVATDSRRNLAKNVALIADLLKIMLLLSAVVIGYLTWRFVL